MKKYVLFYVVVTILIAGCVSTKKYETALGESDTKQTQLEKTSNELIEAKESLTALNTELEALKTEKSLLSVELESKVQANEKLTVSEAVMDTEIEALRQQQGYLEREVERLKLKSGELSAAKEQELASVRQTYDNLVHEMRQEIEQGDVKITQAVDKLSVNFVEKILFDSGKDKIKPAGLDVLKRVGDILKGVVDRQVRVEGHTDNIPIGSRIKKKFPTNWELSTARATTVVRYLRDTVGISPELLSATGYADNRPVADNSTFEGRAQNRRIEIVLLPIDIDRVLKELKK